MLSVIEWKNPEDEQSQLKVQLRSRPGDWALIARNVALLGFAFSPEIKDLIDDKHFEIKASKSGQSGFGQDIYARYVE